MSTIEMPHDFREVLKRAQAGDQDAFSMLYTEYATPLFRYIYFRLPRKEDAEDILQTVFLKAYKALPRFRDLGKSPLTFFYTIARNTIIDHVRRKREVLLDSEAPSLETVPDDTNMADDLLRASDAAGIHDAMTILTDDQRDAITLKYMNDLSNMEIAHVLQKEETAIRQLQSRGLRVLRSQLLKKNMNIEEALKQENIQP